MLCQKLSKQLPGFVLAGRKLHCRQQLLMLFVPAEDPWHKAGVFWQGVSEGSCKLSKKWPGVEQEAKPFICIPKKPTSSAC